MKAMLDVLGDGRPKAVFCVDEFEWDVFAQMLEFLHTGTVLLRPDTVIGERNKWCALVTLGVL